MKPAPFLAATFLSLLPSTLLAQQYLIPLEASVGFGGVARGAEIRSGFYAPMSSAHDVSPGRRRGRRDAKPPKTCYTDTSCHVRP